MRAVCESCAKPQPVDWRGGDHCVWCGEAVRREVRCFWCATWTPAVKFCRTCGAATVDSKVYGAARMLKDAGCDRFTVPRQLAELDREQVENFTRIYQEHAAVAAHHLEQVEFLQQFLEQKHWSAALEASLAPQLPWPLDRLDAVRIAAKLVPSQAGALEKAKVIGTASPFLETRALAVIARLALEDWTALDDVARFTSGSDPALKAEAVLAVSHWRVLFGPGLPSHCRREVLEELRRSPLRGAASTRLAMLGEPTGEPLPAGEFATALITGDIDFLSAAAREADDSMRRFAAAQKLIALGVTAPVADVLPVASEDQQLELLGLLERRRKPAPELRETLFSLAQDTKQRRIHEYACYVLCYGCAPDEALRIARAARGDQQVYQALLQKARLSPSALEEVGEFLLQSGAFTLSQYGMNDAAKQGRMPAGFVQRHWRDATPTARVELCKFGEAQLSEYGDEVLHRFLVDVAFTPLGRAGDVKVPVQAWSGLQRWYNSFGYPRRRPVKVSQESIATFFGTSQQFLIRLAALLQERPHRSATTEILQYPDSSALAGIAGSPREAKAVADALVAIMWDLEVDFGIRLACTDFLGFLGSEPSLRTQMNRLLKSFAGTDLDLQSTRALERMANGPAWN